MMRNPKYTKEEAVALVEKCYDSGEPIFIIQSKDRISWEIVKEYAEKLKNASGPEHPEKPSYKLAEDAELVAKDMLTWQLENQEKVKLPD